MNRIISKLAFMAILTGGVAFGADTNAPAASTPATTEQAAKTHKERKPLTPEEKKKRAEQFQARLKELHAKKEAGTLTDKEKKQLEAFDKRASQMKDKAKHPKPETEEKTSDSK
jgi:hypothetical protein